MLIWIRRNAWKKDFQKCQEFPKGALSQFCRDIGSFMLIWKSEFNDVDFRKIISRMTQALTLDARPSSLSIGGCPDEFQVESRQIGH
jgi:hypothetical protein